MSVASTEKLEADMKNITVIFTLAEARTVVHAIGQGITGDRQDMQSFFGGNSKTWEAAIRASEKVSAAIRGCSCGPKDACSRCPVKP